MLPKTTLHILKYNDKFEILSVVTDKQIILIQQIIIIQQIIKTVYWSVEEL